MKFRRYSGGDTQSNEAKRKAQLGFSLLEMTVAMLLFLIITGSIYGLLQVGRIDRNRSSRRSDVLKNARTAVHLIGRDALNAGLGYHRQGGITPDDFLANRFDTPADADANRDLLTSIVVGNNIYQNGIQDDPNVRTDAAAFAYRDIDFNGGNTIEFGEPRAGGSPDTMQLVTRTPGDAAPANVHDLYMLETNSSQVVLMVTGKVDNSTLEFAPVDPLGINEAFNGSSVLKPCTRTVVTECTTYAGAFTRITLKRIFLVSYKVKQDGTLVRMLYGNNTGNPADQQIQEQPLAYGVKDLQIRYLLNDGRTTDNPVAGADNLLGTADDQPGDVNLITQITVSVKVASTEIDEQTGSPATITLNATFSTRNLQYDIG